MNHCKQHNNKKQYILCFFLLLLQKYAYYALKEFESVERLTQLPQT